jgi:L-threonylcarbamoyladenylate synthase
MNVVKCVNEGPEGGGCHISEDEILSIIRVLKDGGLVVYPTETLYALGADPMNEKAILRLLEVKRRPMGMPLSVVVAGMDEAMKLANLNTKALSVMEKFMPGPLTVVADIKENSGLHHAISSESKVGLRIPDHPISMMLAKRFGPITATSANRHKGKDPTDSTIARQELGDDIDIYIDCGRCRLGAPSTVIDISKGEIQVIREGAISREALHG